jgi:uncharacterized protein (TIGR02453 family)
MSNGGSLEPVLNFLRGLKKNNNKAWFEAHRPAYEDAKSRFEAFVDELIAGLDKVEELRGVTAKDSVMRIFRDVRFSKDKSPYRTSMAAAIGPGGKKSSLLKYYIHLEPDNASMVAGGMHMPESGQLTRFRDTIGRDATRFKRIVNAPEFKRYFGTLEGEKLKTAPQGFARDHPEIELLRLKEVVAIHHLSDKDVLAPKFPEQAVQAFTAMKPFLDYLNSVIQ